MSGRSDSRGRLVLLLIVAMVGSVVLAGRTAYWQVIRHDDLAALARRQSELQLTQASRRGTIYDRTGLTILATDLERSRLTASPHQLTPLQRSEVADELTAILGLEGSAAAGLRRKLATDAWYQVLADGLDESVASRIREAAGAGRLPTVLLEPHPIRSYPLAGGGHDSSLAAHLLGFVNGEGKGQYGVEEAYQADLAGEPRVVLAQRDASGQPLYGSEQVLSEGIQGSDLSLTIHAGLQVKLEEEIFSTWVADRAKKVSAIVMDPYTGEIYAQASYPSYDANDFRAVADEDPGRFVDPVVAEPYEPGSVMKMMTAAAAYQRGVVTATTKVNDTKILPLDGGRASVRDADRVGRGLMTFEDGIARSRNVVAARVALKLGKTTKSASLALYDTWAQLGLDRKTGIDVAGERVLPPKDPAISPWKEIDLANRSFGQSVALTPIQIATAYSAMVNGGFLVAPRVVSAVGERRLVSAPGRRVLSETDSARLVDLMEHVVSTVDLYRDRTQVRGYVVGGKTGTAQIWDSKANGGRGDWKHNIFNFSFVGYIGRQAPRLVVAVRISEGQPTVNRPGTIILPVMSFELFRRIATDAMEVLDLPEVEGVPIVTASR
jgi:stage V sporulation protein D (sporulation-specific penicillin-binding protein)